jgi:hypothetical protein
MVKRVTSVPVIDHLLICSDTISQTRSMLSVTARIDAIPIV